MPRLDEIRDFHRRIGADIPLEYHHTPQPTATDAIIATLKPGSLVINATGLGKDAPGSPLSDPAGVADEGLAWDFNYRGDLLFLRRPVHSSRRRTCESKTAGSISSTAGRGSSPKCSTSIFPPAVRGSTSCADRG